MSENIVSEKMKRSVYLDYPDYRDEPFSTSKKFGVYIPKLNDQVNDMIERHEAKERAKYKSSMPNVRDTHNIFSQSYVHGGDQTAPHQGENIFQHSIRSHGCNHCNPAVFQPLVQDAQGGLTGNLCPCCKNDAHCCCRNKFRIRRSSSKCDSAYSHDTNTWKSKFHGNKFGYYKNRPYTQIGSDYIGSKFYKDHPEMLTQAGPLLSRPCTKVGTPRQNFEHQLITDGRTGQTIGQRSMNPVMNTLLKESCKFRKNQAIQEGILKLKDTGCLNLPCERIKRAKPILEKGYVHNDYHLKESKNGYGRTVGGRALV